MDVTQIPGDDGKWCLEFTKLQENGAQSLSSMDFYKGFEMVTEIFENMAEEED
jgi:hypothetical protein